MRRSLVVVLAALVALAAAARPAVAQAWVPRDGQGSVSFITQMIDHYGRFLDDGSRLNCCGTTNLAVDVEIDYALTDRWSMSASLPYIVSKYRDGSPTEIGVPFLPYPAADSCHCVHGTFQDFGLSAHYNLINVHRKFMLTPSVSIGMPTHAYNHVGEAVAGFGLKEFHAGAAAGYRLDWLLRGLSVEGRYAYAVVPRVLDISHNRSNATLDGGFDFARHFSAHGILNWQHTYDGLRFPDDVKPFPERYDDFHRLLQDNYLQVGGGVTYGIGVWDVSASYLSAVRGTNSHEVRVYTVSLGRSFRVG